MAISVQQVYNQVLRDFNDIDQLSFLNILNEVDQDIQSKVRLVPQQLVQLSTTVYTPPYQTQYYLGDTAMNIWSVGYQTSSGSGFDLRPSSFDYLDYQQPGWRYVVGGTPAWWFPDGLGIGFFPMPNLATSGGYPIINVYCTEQPSPYLITGYLPSIVHSAYAWRYAVSTSWAISNYPERAQTMATLAASSLNELKRYIHGRNPRNKQKLIANIRPVRII